MDTSSEETGPDAPKTMPYEHALSAIMGGPGTGHAARRVSWADPEACIWWDGQRVQHSWFQGRGYGWTLTPEDEAATDWITDHDPPVLPEEETPLQAAEGRFIQAKIDAGWTHREGATAHPSDPDLCFLVDPLSGEITFSRKLASVIDQDPDAEEMMRLTREELQRQRQAAHEQDDA
jgi:hypothetical protein